MKKVRRITCLCMVCCLCMLLAVPCLAATAPTDLSKDCEEFFPVAGCEYEDIFLRTLYTDGAYSEAASIQLRMLFENDTDAFMTDLTAMPYVIEQNVLNLLLYSYYFTEEDTLWLRDKAAELQKKYESKPTEKLLAQNIQAMAEEQWEEVYGPKPDPSTIAPKDLSKEYEGMFPVAGCAYDDIFSRVIFTEGGYVTAAEEQLKLLLVEDTDHFVKSLSGYTPELIREYVIGFLVDSYDTESDLVWLQRWSAKQLEVYPETSAERGLLQEFQDRAAAKQAELNGTAPSDPQDSAGHHSGCIIACAVLAVVIVGCTVVNVRLHRKNKKA